MGVFCKRSLIKGGSTKYLEERKASCCYFQSETTILYLIIIQYKGIYSIKTVVFIWLS
jgi:hypothetical protein